MMRSSKKWTGNSWGGMSKQGFSAVPVRFARHYNKLGLNADEAMIVISILSYSWADSDVPYPSQALLAEIAGVSERTIKRKLKRLAELELVRLVPVFSRSKGYDFSPLFDALRKLDPDNFKPADEDDTDVPSDDTDVPSADDASSEGDTAVPSDDTDVPLRRNRSTTHTSLPTEEDGPGGEAVSAQDDVSSIPRESTPQGDAAARLRAQLLKAKAQKTVEAARQRAAEVNKANTAKRQKRSAALNRSKPRPRNARERYLAREPEEYKANDVWFIIADAWAEKWPRSKPSMFAAKDRSLAKKLLESYGGADVKQVIEEAIARWEEVSRRFRVRGHPSVGVFWGFRDSIFPYILDGPASSGVKSGSKYTETEDDKVGGW